jgi:glycosyltransferase involved in cell wall biosynthesis
MPPVVHVYTVLYNEEILLPYFLRHYGVFAEKIVCFDNGSTDRSAEIIDAHPATERIVFETDGLFDRIHLQLKSEYRKSRGRADWVICVDCDEFIYHPELPKLLQSYQDKGITYPKIDGFEMVSDQTPKTDGQIYEVAKIGFPSEGYSKRVVFNPSLEVFFEAGCHSARVEGNKFESKEPEIKLLHYRFLGRDFFIQRSIERKARLSDENKKCGWGTHYLNPEGYFANLFDEVKAISKPVL